MFSIESLLANCDQAFPNTGTWGYATILSGDLTIGLSYTANATTNALTTPSAHGLVTGSRLRLVGGLGTLPTPLIADTDYYATVSSSTVLTLSATLGGATIDLTDAGSGTLLLTEQPLTIADPLSVLVNKEVDHPSWAARVIIENLGAATAVAGKAEKPSKNLTIENTDTTNLSYQHYLFIESASANALGSAPSGAGYYLHSESTAQTIAPGDPSRLVLFKLRARNV